MANLKSGTNFIKIGGVTRPKNTIHCQLSSSGLQMTLMTLEKHALTATLFYNEFTVDDVVPASMDALVTWLDTNCYA